MLSLERTQHLKSSKAFLGQRDKLCLMNKIKHTISCDKIISVFAFSQGCPHVGIKLRLTCFPQCEFMSFYYIFIFLY